MGKNDTFLNATMGDYRLQEIIAVGGMSRVYLGFDTQLERRAAVKVLELDQSWVDETIVQRFEREARAVAALEHDNIITIYQYGKHHEGAYFLAMQYIDGSDLRQIFKDYRKRGEQMPPERLVKIMRQVASAMDFAHAAGIIHRDIKPSNVLVTARDRAVLTDFGLVLRQSVDQTMGTAFGTPRYIAPEQAVASQQAVSQSDIYALGVIVYEALTGQTPFDGETPMEIALAHVSDPPPPPRDHNPNIPQVVNDALLKALSKDPTERHQTAAQFIEEIAAGYDIGWEAEPAVAADPPEPNAALAVVKSPTSQSGRAAVPAPINLQGPNRLTSAAPRKKRNPFVSFLGVLLLIAVIGGIGFVYWNNFMGGGELPFLPTIGQSANGGGMMGGSGGAVELRYDAVSLVVYNGGEPLTNTQPLSFVRGEPNADRDDYAGDRIPGDRVDSGNCFQLFKDGETPISNSNCESSNEERLLDEGLFFWRTEPVNQTTFEVRWDGEVVHRCDTIRADETGTCRFDLPQLDEE